MKKIIVASCVFPPEPVVSAFLSYDLAEKLYSIGEVVEVISPKPSRPLNYIFPNEDASLPFKHHVLNSYTCAESNLWGRFKESYSFGREIYGFIKAHHQDIGAIYANVWPLFSQYYLAKAAKKYGIPYCIHVQDVYPESYSQKAPSVIGIVIKMLFMPMDKYVLRNAAKIIAISPTEAEYLSKSRNVVMDNILVIRNWQKDEQFASHYRPISKEPHKLRFMYLGSINPTANVEYLIRCFADFDVNDVSLSIIGNGPNRESCERLAKSYNMDMEFGVITPDKVPDKQSEADVLMLSLREGVAKTATPSKLTAYLYSGRPVVACVDRDSDCADIIRDAQCGYVVAPGDEEGLRKVVKKIMSQPISELNKMGASGADYAKYNLSKKKNLDRLVDIILNISKNG